MKSARTRRHTIQALRPWALGILIVMWGAETMFVAPNSGLVVALYMILITIIGYIVSTYIFPLRLQILGSIGIVVFLLVNYAVGFSLLNTALLISLIITISQLIK